MLLLRYRTRSLIYKRHEIGEFCCVPRQNVFVPLTPLFFYEIVFLVVRDKIQIRVTALRNNVIAVK